MQLPSPSLPFLKNFTLLHVGFRFFLVTNFVLHLHFSAWSRLGEANNIPYLTWSISLWTHCDFHITSTVNSRSDPQHHRALDSGLLFPILSEINAHIENGERVRSASWPHSNQHGSGSECASRNVKDQTCAASLRCALLSLPAQQPGAPRRCTTRVRTTWLGGPRDPLRHSPWRTCIGKTIEEGHGAVQNHKERECLDHCLPERVLVSTLKR